MRDIRLLTSLYMKSLFGLNRLRNSKDNKSRRKYVLWFIGAPFIMLILLFSVGMYCALMSAGLKQLGQPEAMPVTMFALAGMLTLISCAYRGGEVLLGFKDFDLQLSMPLSLTSVAVSRLIVQYITSMLTVIMVMLPAGIVYAYFERPEWHYYPIYIVSMAVMPLLPAVIGSIIGALIMRVSARFRASKYMNLVFMMAFMAAYMYLIINLNMQDETAFGMLALNVSTMVSRVYPPALLFERAITGGFIEFVSFTLASGAVFALASYLFAKNLRALKTKVSEKRARGKFKLKALKAQSPLRALYAREISRYFASTIYVMNTAFGIVIALVASIAALIAGADGVYSLLGEQSADMIAVIIPVALGFMTGTCSTTATSISLEGRPVWVIKSIPVRARDLFLSKVLVNLTIILPACVIAPAAMCIVFRPDFMSGLACFLMPSCYGSLVSVFGLWINLRMHRFDWKTETEIVKQSASAGIPIFLVMFLCAAPGILSFVYPDYRLLITYAFIAVSALAACALAAIIHQRAEKELRML